uniref:Uncharacterized protein n=1 Tax=Trypanosoma congolense (strain IL3000) TaxID=1068625 RepID=G0US03_TRYCI|nr:conserved hypothetical protein [Trypanosoma congolense IL3000]
MVTEEIFRMFVEQAWNSTAGSRAENNDVAAQHLQQQRQQRRGPTPNVATFMPIYTPFTAQKSSPLDYPNILMAYYTASKNSLLRYHYDIPILQPRTVFSSPQRPTLPSAEHTHTGPVPSHHEHRYYPRHHNRSHRAYRRYAGAPPATRRSSSPRAYRHREFEPSISMPSAGHLTTTSDTVHRASGYTDLHMIPHVPGRESSSWSHSGTEDMTTEKAGALIVDDAVRPSWSPQQVRYRLPTSADNTADAPQRITLGTPLDIPDYATLEDDEECTNANEFYYDHLGNSQNEEEEPQGRRTVWLEPRHTQDHSTVPYRNTFTPRPRHSTTHQNAPEDETRSTGITQEQIPQWGHQHYRINLESEDHAWQTIRGTYASRAAEEGEVYLATHSTRRTTLLDNRRL